MVFNFILARKFPRNNIKGLELRSAALNRAVLFNTKGDGYEKVRDALEEFDQEKVSEGGADVKLKGIGKSYEVTGKDALEFIGRLNFINEGHNDYLVFLNNEAPKLGEIQDLELDSKAALLTMSKEADSFESLSEGMSEVLERYDIGIMIKDAEEDSE